MGISILSDKSWTNDPPSVNQDVSHNIPKISLPISIYIYMCSHVIMLYMNIYPIYDPPSVSGANIGNPICHPAVPGRRLTPVAPSCYVECGRYHGRCGDIALLMLWLGMRHRRLQKTKDILVNTCKRNMFCDNFALFTYAYIGGTFFFWGRLTSHSLCNVLLV